ncbi:LacI family DNA-binding transcriptional regulator [Anaerosporobacter sp.]|uniref:LacI family DNA-binding transcriptional regulator n=1 Tax=Anaerosporobacter sp. TaxID=1872529 RepID=UPI00286F7711|nr:LacI family DNA-binding transcriptional regulator [Anaerosporobacter sp.]
MANITIKDVAKEAGVSIGTVSNALNGNRYINPDTKQRVMDAVKKLNYIPNLNGRYLKAGATKNLGFFTNSISGPYFCSLMDYMSRECERRGYNLNVFITRDSSVIMGNILGKNLDGVLIYEDTTVNENEIRMFEKEGIKVVFLDREVSKNGVSSILFDSYKAGYEATKHLVNLGHQRIAFIECVDEVTDSLRRKEGYKAALRECNLPVEDELILQGAFEEEYTYNTIKTFVKFNSLILPDAFLAGNDLSAIGCIKALESDGYRVPEDFSVIGFDDIDIAQYFSPSLTTVRNPIARQGTLAIDTLIDMIEEKEQGTIIKLDGNLVIRNSCTRKK